MLLVSINWGQGSIHAEGIFGGAPSTATCSGMRNACQLHFDEGTSAKLRADPDPGWVLDSWDGACSGAEGCSIHISGHQQVTARFKPPVSRSHR